MNPRIEELVERLAQIAIAEHVDEPERLAAALSERQALLSALQSADFSTLTREHRALTKERLCGILTRGAALLAQLRERQGRTARELEQVACGRAAMRGYGETVSANPAGRHRIG